MGAGSGLIDKVLGKIERAVVNLAPRFLRVLWYFSRTISADLSSVLQLSRLSGVAKIPAHLVSKL